MQHCEFRLAELRSQTLRTIQMIKQITTSVPIKPYPNIVSPNLSLKLTLRILLDAVPIDCQRIVKLAIQQIVCACLSQAQFLVPNSTYCFILGQGVGRVCSLEDIRSMTKGPLRGLAA